MWLHRNKSAIFTAGVLCATAIVCVYLFIPLRCGSMLNYSIVVKSQIGHRATAQHHQRHTRETHTSTEQADWLWPVFTCSPFYSLQRGKERESRGQSINKKVRISSGLIVASGQVWQQQEPAPSTALMWKGIPPTAPRQKKKNPWHRLAHPPDVPLPKAINHLKMDMLESFPL